MTANMIKWLKTHLGMKLVEDNERPDEAVDLAFLLIKLGVGAKEDYYQWLDWISNGSE